MAKAKLDLKLCPFRMVMPQKFPRKYEEWTEEQKIEETEGQLACFGEACQW